MIEPQQNKAGVKTFLVTFAASLLLFGVFYLLVNGKNNAPETGIESDQSQTIDYIGDTRELDAPATTETLPSEMQPTEEPIDAVSVDVPVENAIGGVLDEAGIPTENSEETPVATTEVLGVEDSLASNVTSEEEDSPFAQLVASQTQEQGSAPTNNSQTQPRAGGVGAVLAETDTTNQSTVPVPDTGNISITLSIIASVALFGFFIFVVMLNPRKYALSRFESDAIGK